MNVTCPECSSVFRVDPAKIPLAGVRARCSVCGGVIAIGERGRIDDDFTASAPAAHATQTPARQRSSVSAPLSPRPPVSMPTPPQPMHAGFGAPAAQPSAAPMAPAASAPAPQAPSASRMSPFEQTSTPQPSMPSGRTTPASSPSASPPPAAQAAQSHAAAAPAPAPASPAPVARAAAPQTSGAPAARPPINPFLANDPNQKAKRLARALVSDIIAYFPDRHAQAKRDGTLRETFREEIKKSYEEYVEQMGKEFAENTTHFQDALNDVLAGGNRIF
jgi:predicted Zn finger-like uncharacterized protein